MADFRIKPQSEIDLEASAAAAGVLQNRIAYMQFQDALKDRQLSNLLASMDRSISGGQGVGGGTPPSPTDQSQPQPMVNLPPLENILTGKTPQAPPQFPQQGGGTPPPRSGESDLWGTPQETIQQLRQIATQNPELRESAYRRLREEDLRMKSEAKEYLGIFKTAIDEAIRNGDGETVEAVSKALQELNNPYLNRISKAYGKIDIHGRENYTRTGMVTPEEWASITNKFPSETSGIDPTRPVKIKYKRGKIELIENVKEDTPKTSAQASYKGFHDQVKTEHPDWPEWKVQREAAKMDREEAEKIKQQGGGEGGYKSLDDVPQNIRRTANAIVNYKIPLPTGFALRSPYWQQVLDVATMMDPSFDATQYNARLAIRKDFASGKAANNIRSLNTVVRHLDTLVKAAKRLDNSPIQLWNKIANAGITAVGDRRVTDFNVAAGAVESELATVFKGMGATDQEIKAWRDRINSSQSPQQIWSAVNQSIELMAGRLAALKDQYRVGMGKPKDFHFLSNQSRQILKKIGRDPDSFDPVDSGTGTEDDPLGLFNKK